MRVSLIAAVGAGGVIGNAGGLPWHLPADLKRFKALTLGHHLLVGRRTYESIGRPLPGRHMLVLSRNPAWPTPEGVVRVGSAEEAFGLARAAGETELFVAGGGDVYEALLPHADRLYLTAVEGEVAGDTYFPTWDRRAFRQVASEEHPADERHALPFRFEIWERSDRP